MLGSALSARLSRHDTPEQVVLIGAAMNMSACTAMLLGNLAWPATIWVFIIPMVVYAAGMGLVLPNAMAVALRPFPHIAGTASAMLGFIQMTLSGAATALVGLFLIDTPAPMVTAMFLITAVALLLGASVYRLRAR
jgi:DHA1 family bicyclomycin/chloramphenicol resistance-like MFS transporter